MTNLIIKNVDPFTKSLLYKVKDEEGFSTLAESLGLVMYEYYEKKELNADEIEDNDVQWCWPRHEGQDR